jgi:hypothetical protein
MSQTTLANTSYSRKLRRPHLTAHKSDLQLSLTIDAALSAGVAVHTMVKTLERKEMPHVIAWPHGFGSNVSWRSVQELSRFGAIEKSPHSAKPEPIRDTLLGFPQT